MLCCPAFEEDYELKEEGNVKSNSEMDSGVSDKMS